MFATNRRAPTRADGYARASGELGVMLASTGPGTSNTVTGLYEAQYASSRVLLITGQAETAFYGKGLGYVHEAENQLPMLRTVVRRVESPRHIEQLDGALNAVVADMRTGRGAPGAVEVPIDLQYAASPAPTPVPAAIEFAPKTADVDAAAERIGASQRRLIIAGGGVIAAGAAAELQALAERLDGAGGHHGGRPRRHFRGSSPVHRQLLAECRPPCGGEGCGLEPRLRRPVCRRGRWAGRKASSARRFGAGGYRSEHRGPRPSRGARRSG